MFTLAPFGRRKEMTLMQIRKRSNDMVISAATPQ
jgi:hypothetical protein